MSSINGSYIIQDGLVTYLDAANPNSYSGAGATWSDLYSTLQTTLVNGILWDNAAGGAFIFDGINDYINLYNHIPYQQFTHNFTIQVITMATFGYSGLLYDGSFQTNGVYYEVGNANRNLVVITNNQNISPSYSSIGITSVTAGVIYDVTGTFNGSKLSIYLNGSLISSIFGMTPSAPTGVPSFGVNYALANLCLYRIGLYNTALNASQVMQNWMAIRNRFSNNKNNYYFYYLSLISGKNGLIEARDNLLNRTNTLIANNLLDTATFLMVPVGYTTSVIQSIIPNSLLSYGGITFSRGSAATRINSSNVIETLNNNIPQYDYGATLSFPSLLLEPQRTNNVLYSQDFSNTYWTTSRLNGGTGSLPIITANYATAPDGTQTAARFQFALNGGTAIGDLSVINKLGIITATYGVISIWMKSNTAATYSVLLRAGGGTALLPQLVTTSWNRYNFPATNCDGIYWGLRGTFNTSNSADILAWGAQVETAASGSQNCAFVTSYIPTTSTTVTRSASTIQKSGIYTNNLVSSVGGTWLIDLSNNISTTSDNGLAQQLGLGNNFVGASADNIWIGGAQASGRLRVWTQVAGVLATTYTTLTLNAKIAVAWNGATISTFVNGTKVNTSSFTPVALDTLRTFSVGNTYYINQMALWNTPLTDSQCVTLTT